ncbi:MAG: hypothetical protein ACE5KU_06615 [Nitrososphaerales archaeon]
MSRLSRLEITVKTVGATGLLLGVAAVVYTVTLLYEELPRSKYLMVGGIAFGIFLCYLGYISLRFRQRETGHIIHEYDIL